MHEDVRGKKLLILGAYGSEIEIVNVAHRMGVYTITTDNHMNWDEAPAKKISDEAWNISWSDIDTLADMCRKNHVDGVIAGFSERRVNFAAKLSEKLHTSFYAGEGGQNYVISSTSRALSLHVLTRGSESPRDSRRLLPQFSL